MELRMNLDQERQLSNAYWMMLIERTCDINLLELSNCRNTQYPCEDRSIFQSAMYNAHEQGNMN